MSFRFDLAPNLQDPSVVSHEKRGAFNSEVGLAVHGLFNPHPERPDQLSIGVGKKGIVEIKFLRELGVRLHGVRTYAEHVYAFELIEFGTELVSFYRSPGGVVFRIEE